MRIERLLAAACLSLFGLCGLSGMTHAAEGAEASAECVSCHDDDDLPDMSRGPHAGGTKKAPMSQAAEALARRPMGDAADARTPNCITCHGPSPAHAKKSAAEKVRPHPDRMFSKKSPLSAEQRSQVCLDCHQKDRHRALWSGSAHQSADLACNSCHKVHANHDKVLARDTQPEVCLGCHKTQRAELSRPSHHPIPEGRMGCSDCHAAHGSAGPALALRDSTNATCFTCHAEKRGPFVHAHEPVGEDCSNCHNPHGSTIQSMLKARAPMLCQQCHTPHVAGGVGAVGGQSGVFTPAVPGVFAPQVGNVTSGKNVVNLWQGRSCMNCHTQVHGSNNPSATNPTPQLLLR